MVPIQDYYRGSLYFKPAFSLSGTYFFEAFFGKIFNKF